MIDVVFVDDLLVTLMARSPQLLRIVIDALVAYASFARCSASAKCRTCPASAAHLSSSSVLSAPPYVSGGKAPPRPRLLAELLTIGGVQIFVRGLMSQNGLGFPWILATPLSSKHHTEVRAPAPAGTESSESLDYFSRSITRKI